MGIYDETTLRMWRAKERLTLKQAGELFGVTRQTLSRWEDGPVPEDFDGRLADAASALEKQRDEALVSAAHKEG